MFVKVQVIPSAAVVAASGTLARVTVRPLVVTPFTAAPEPSTHWMFLNVQSVGSAPSVIVTASAVARSVLGPYVAVPPLVFGGWRLPGLVFQGEPFSVLVDVNAKFGIDAGAETSCGHSTFLTRVSERFWVRVP